MEAPEGFSSQGSNLITTLLVNEDKQTQPGPVLLTLDQGGLDSIFLNKIKELFFPPYSSLSLSVFLLSFFCSCCALYLAPLFFRMWKSFSCQKEDCTQSLRWVTGKISPKQR